MKLGMAIAAMIPMIAITSDNSRNVKPAAPWRGPLHLRFDLICPSKSGRSPVCGALRDKFDRPRDIHKIPRYREKRSCGSDVRGPCKRAKYSRPGVRVDPD